MKLSRIPLITAMMFVSSSLAFAQDEVVKVETNIVSLNVSVTDRNGNNVGGLSKDQFVVTDNGIKQDIDSFSAENSPVSVGIVFDIHQTVGGQTVNVLDALRQFTQTLGERDRFFVTAFGDNGHLTTEFVPTEEQLRQFVDGGSQSGVTSLYDSIFDASKKVASMGNPKRVLIIISNGADPSLQSRLSSIRTRIRGVNVPVYLVTFGRENKQRFSYADMYRNGPRQTFDRSETSELDKGVLIELSKSTGGQSFEVDVRNRYYLAALCSKVVSEIGHQYMIGFYPDVHDGRWHKLTVSLKPTVGKKYKVSGRRGYQSPGK